MNRIFGAQQGRFLSTMAAIAMSAAVVSPLSAQQTVDQLPSDHPDSADSTMHPTTGLS